MNVDYEPEVSRQVPAYLSPQVAGVVAPHYIPMLLHEQHTRPRRMHSYVVNTVADLRGRVWNVLRKQSTVDRPPRLAGVVGSERARCRYRDENSPGIARIENDCMQTHSTCSRLPVGSCPVSAQPGKLLPRLAAVRRSKQGRVFNSGVDRVGIGQRRLEVPDSLELPGTWCAVIPLVSGNRFASCRIRIVDELVALGLGHAFGRCGRFTCRCSGLRPRPASVV